MTEAPPVLTRITPRRWRVWAALPLPVPPTFFQTSWPQRSRSAISVCGRRVMILFRYGLSKSKPEWAGSMRQAFDGPQAASPASSVPESPSPAPAPYLPAGRRDVFVALLLGAGILLIWLHAAGPGAKAGYDFFSAYYAAAREVVGGVSPYQQLAKLSIDPASGGLPGTGYVYPPLLAVLLSLPVRVGWSAKICWLLWTLVNALALVWMGYELNYNLRNSRSWTGAMAFALAAVAPAVVGYDLGLGQADLLMASLAVVACALWLRGRSGAASLVLGATIAIKPTLALLLLVWLWKGDWRTALR